MGDKVINLDECNKCRYINCGANEYPCNHCKNNYVNKYEPIPDLGIGDLVIIGECTHDVGYRGQVGIIMKVNKLHCNDSNENYYSVLAYDKGAERYWACGFKRSDLKQIDGNMKNLLRAYEEWKKQ